MACFLSCMTEMHYSPFATVWLRLKLNFSHVACHTWNLLGHTWHRLCGVMALSHGIPLATHEIDSAKCDMGLAKMTFTYPYM